MMKNRAKYHPNDLASILEVGFNKQIFGSEDDAHAFIQEYLDDPEFVEAVKELIIDPSETFAQKADRYVYAFWLNEEQSLSLFKDIWEVVSNGQPWPLDK